MLMSMAMKFDDLQDLGAALDDAQGITEEQLRDAIEQNTGSIPGLGLTDIHLLDAQDLGDGGFGMSMTLDLGGFLKALQGAFAGSDATPDPELDDFVINMKMYVFGRGDLRCRCHQHELWLRRRDWHRRAGAGEGRGLETASLAVSSSAVSRRCCSLPSQRSHLAAFLHFKSVFA